MRNDGYFSERYNEEHTQDNESNYIDFIACGLTVITGIFNAKILKEYSNVN